MDQCTSCRKAPVEVVETPDDPAEPYEVCSSCYRRLISHSLRPMEWYNLSSIHGRRNDLLGPEYYDEKNGTALQPAAEVSGADLFPCPGLQDVIGSPEDLLTFILTRSHIHEEGPVETWYLDDELVSAMLRFSPSILGPVFSTRLQATRNPDQARVILHLIGLTLGAQGAELVRDSWERFAFGDCLSAIAFAASKCLPMEEAHRKLVRALSGMDVRERCVQKHNLELFETRLNLDWIEQNVSTPVDSSWGLIAASSRFDWGRAVKWLSTGRPLSLVALDALHWCVCSGRKPALEDPPPALEFASVLSEYLDRDNVPRVRERIQDLLRSARQ